MNKLFVALSLYVGLAAFFAVNALLIVQGASIMTGMVKGLLALLVFAALGIVAGVATRGKPVESGEKEGLEETSPVPES